MTKRKLIIISTILSAVILGLFVFLIVLISGYGNGNSGEKYDVASISKILNEKSVGITAKNILVIAESKALNQGENSYLAVKSAMSKDYRGIFLDVAFRKDGTPVLAKNFDDVKDDSTTLEKVFEEVKSTDFKLVINMGEISCMEAVRKLVDKYDVKGNVVFYADDDIKIIAIRRHLPNCKICLQMDTDGVDFNNVDEIRGKLAKIKQSGASYVAVKSELITKELAEACVKAHIGTVAYGARKNEDVKRALSEEIDMFITDSPNDANRIIGSLN